MNGIRRKGVVVIGMAAMVLLVGCGYGSQPEDHRAHAEQEVRAAAAEWVNTDLVKNPGGFAAFYAEDGVVFPPGAPAVRGKTAITELWKQFAAMPGLEVKIQTDSVEAAKSGELAYETGHYMERVNDAQGQRVTKNGKYVVVWKKQADGKWKPAVDIFNEDQ